MVSQTAQVHQEGVKGFPDCTSALGGRYGFPDCTSPLRGGKWFPKLEVHYEGVKGFLDCTSPLGGGKAGLGIYSFALCFFAQNRSDY